ncbi:hypothetical protein KM043_001195 [Ampulex compressa]|nr:hypothetical protein KM043_001195 [Ampulex compressa]
MELGDVVGQLGNWEVFLDNHGIGWCGWTIMEQGGTVGQSWNRELYYPKFLNFLSGRFFFVFKSQLFPKQSSQAFPEYRGIPAWNSSSLNGGKLARGAERENLIPGPGKTSPTDPDVFAQIRFHEAVSDGVQGPETHCDGARYAILSQGDLAGTVAAMVSLGTCPANKLPFVLET